MHLTNYKIGYSPTFDCTIHGTIRMTQDEWATVYSKIYEYAKKQSRATLSVFYSDVQRRIYTADERSYSINIRVPLTQYLVQTFKLPHYKNGNYRIKITFTLFDT